MKLHRLRLRADADLAEDVDPRAYAHSAYGAGRAAETQNARHALFARQI